MAKQTPDRTVEILVGGQPISNSNPLPTPGGGSGGGVVTQGTAGTDPWKVDDDASQMLLTAIDGHVDALEARTGDVTETAPATDTASSGLNGRLQRIAQRLTSLIALLPGSLGQKTMANSMAVVVASDQTAVPSMMATGKVYDAVLNEAVLVKYANGVATASGDNVVLAAVSGKKIRVLASEWACLEAGTVVTAQYQDNATTTGRGIKRDLFKSADGTSSQGDVKAVNPLGYFETAEGVGLDLNLSGAIDVGWAIVYAEVE